MENLILIDAHVHIQTIYNLEEYFNSTFYNFTEVAKLINGSTSWRGFLLLTEVKGVNQFEMLKKQKIIGGKENYSIHSTDEKKSLLVSSENGDKVFVIAGRQIIAKDNIEVLALCTEKEFEENQSLSKTVESINSENGIAVLPWGVGKWTGKRKKIIIKYLDEYKNSKFFLGDNSGRPMFWSEPNLFKIGNGLGHFVLPGSDALAIPSEVNKTASYGFFLNNVIDEAKPSKSIKDILTKLEEPPKLFGKLENPLSFLKNQITMQLKKRRK